MKYVMVLYDFDSKLIWDTAIPSKTKLRLVTSYKHLFYLIQRRGVQPQLQRLDNECSNLLKLFMTYNDVTYQLTPKENTPVIIPRKKPVNITYYRAWHQLTRTFHCRNGENSLNKVTFPLTSSAHP